MPRQIGKALHPKYRPNWSESRKIRFIVNLARLTSNQIKNGLPPCFTFRELQTAFGYRYTYSTLYQYVHRLVKQGFVIQEVMPRESAVCPTCKFLRRAPRTYKFTLTAEGMECARMGLDAFVDWERYKALSEAEKRGEDDLAQAIRTQIQFEKISLSTPGAILLDKLTKAETTAEQNALAEELDRLLVASAIDEPALEDEKLIDWIKFRERLLFANRNPDPNRPLRIYDFKSTPGTSLDLPQTEHLQANNNPK